MLAQSKATTYHSGIALLSVLITAAIVTSISTTIFTRNSHQYSITNTATDSTRGYLFALGADQVATSLLLADKNDIDTLADNWNVEQNIADDFTVRIVISDLESSFNINNLTLATKQSDKLLSKYLLEYLLSLTREQQNITSNSGEDELYRHQNRSYFEQVCY